MELKQEEFEKLDSTKAGEIIYSREDKTLTIIYADGTMRGFCGDIAIEKAKKIKAEEDIL